MKIKEIISEIKIGQSNTAYSATPGVKPPSVKAPAIPKVPSIPSISTAPKAPTAASTTAAKPPAQPAAGSGSTTLGNKSPGSSTLGSQTPGAATIPKAVTPGASTQPPTQTPPSTTPGSQDQEEDQDISSGPRGVLGGIKAGLGMNPDQSFGKGLATKALNAMGMSNTAAALNPDAYSRPISSTGGRFDPASKSQYKVGGTLKHPKMGDLNTVKVTDYGVTAYSPKLGHDIRLGPQALTQIQGSRK